MYFRARLTRNSVPRVLAALLHDFEKQRHAAAASPNYIRGGEQPKRFLEIDPKNEGNRARHVSRSDYTVAKTYETNEPNKFYYLPAAN